MDLLYNRYSNPLELMKIYINQGRFGEFVENILEMENKRKKEEIEKENENQLWQLYLHSLYSMPEVMSFEDWKKEVQKKPKQVQEQNISKEEVLEIVNSSTSILDNFEMK